MHLVRCLELVGELSSAAHGRFKLHANRAEEDLETRMERLRESFRSCAQNRMAMGSSSNPSGAGDAGARDGDGHPGGSGTAAEGQGYCVPEATLGFSQAHLRQLAIAFGTNPSALTPAVSRMWIAGDDAGVDISSIIGGGVSASALLFD